MSIESDRRAELLERDGHQCMWPACTLPLGYDNPLEMAHIEGKKMGGRGDEAHDIDNLVILCRLHHRMLDGEQRLTRRERIYLLRAALGRTV